VEGDIKGSGKKMGQPADGGSAEPGLGRTKRGSNEAGSPMPRKEAVKVVSPKKKNKTWWLKCPDHGQLKPRVTRWRRIGRLLG